MRRLFVESLHPGPVTLDEAQSRHARAALRLSAGDPVELITPDGALATGRVVAIDPRVTVEIESITPPAAGFTLRVASAVPKGDRANWLVEKLSEIGVTTWTPLRTARSVVHPEGEQKFGRWRRIAIEAAKQSKRPGVMRIDPLISLDDLLNQPAVGNRVYLSTAGARTPLRIVTPGGSMTLLIGPEGGWTPGEEAAMAALGLTAGALGPTILRVETAAVVAAGIIAAIAPQTP